MSVVSLLPLLFLTEPRLTIVVGVILLSGQYFVNLYGIRVGNCNREIGTLRSILDLELEQKIHVHKIMQATSMYSVFDERVDERLTELDTATKRMDDAQMFYEEGLDMTTSTAFIVTIVLGILEVHLGWMSLPDLVAFISAFESFAAVVKSLSDIYVQYQLVKSSLTEFLALESYYPILFDQILPPDDITAGVMLRDVSFAYPTNPSRPVLQGVNFVFPPQTAIAVLGKSGSGKSTITKIILRYK